MPLRRLGLWKCCKWYRSPDREKGKICENVFHCPDAKTGDFIVIPSVFKSCCCIYIFVVKYCFKGLQVGGLQAKAKGNCGAHAWRRWSAFENGFLSGVALYGDLVTCWWGSGGSCVESAPCVTNMCTSRGPLFQCVEYTLYYIMCTMVLLANVGETMLSRAATLYQLFARRITMTKGNLLGNYIAITEKGTAFQELRFLTLYWT